MLGLIKSRSNVFLRSEYDIGRTSIIPHRIDSGDSAPHFQQPMTQLPLTDDQVKNMLQHNITALPWCSNVVMVRKQDDTMRFCNDYMKTNEHIEKDSSPCQNRYLSGHLKWLSIL